jgi:hypothetical protein
MPPVDWRHLIRREGSDVNPKAATLAPETTAETETPAAPTQQAIHHDDRFDVDLMAEPRRPITDPTLGIHVDPIAPKQNYSRRLVSLGDSLTQGFHHFAIHDTDISWPAMIAERLGLDPDTEFSFPQFTPPGGYPLNLEDMLRLDDGHIIHSVEHIVKYLEEVKRNYAPEGEGMLPAPDSRPNDNLAVWGWDVRDLLERTAQTELDAVHGSWFDRVLPTVDHAENRTGVTVLAEWEDVEPVDGGEPVRVRNLSRTALELAAKRGAAGDGIETLTVWIGSNNALASVGTLKIIPSGDDYQDLQLKGAYNVWQPKHFDTELRILEAEVRKIRADHVIWATIPHITIPPLAKGVGDRETGEERLAENKRYFPYYARPWQTTESLDAAHEAHLTGIDAWTIDSVIDAYNVSIADMVTRAREDGLDWRLVDACAVLDRLAVRRNGGGGGQSYDYLPPYELPKEYVERGLDTHFISVNPDGTLAAGGIIGLDGVHPTTAGYGLIAHEFMKVMHQAGVQFPDVADPDEGPQPDWAGILRRDTLLTNLPTHVDGVLALIRKLEEEWDLLTHGIWM